MTTPIEDAVIGVPGLATLRSQSVAGLSAITAVFRSGTTTPARRIAEADIAAAITWLNPRCAARSASGSTGMLFLAT